MLRASLDESSYGHIGRISFVNVLTKRCSEM